MRSRSSPRPMPSRPIRACKATATSDPGGYNAFWLDPGTRLATVRGEHRTSFIVEPANGKVPYTPDGLKAFQAARAGMNMDGPEKRALGERCLLGFGSTSGPPMLPDVYNNNYQIVQSPDAVMILVEMVHDARVVRMNGKHLPQHDHAVDGRFDRPLGRRHAGGRDHEPAPGTEGALRHQAALLPAADRQGDRALHARRRERDRLPVHGRGQRRLHAAVERRSAAEAGRRT